MKPITKAEVEADACIRWGFCCSAEPCQAAEMGYLYKNDACEMLEWENGNAVCRLIRLDQTLNEAKLSYALGVGTGCLCPENPWRTTRARAEKGEEL